jgi:hypothetical protein
MVMKSVFLKSEKRKKKVMAKERKKTVMEKE